MVEFLTRYPVNTDSYVICLNTVFHCWDLCKLPDNVIVHRISFWCLRTIKRNLWWSFDWWTSQKVILIFKLVNMYVQSFPRTILMTIIQMHTIVLYIPKEDLHSGVAMLKTINFFFLQLMVLRDLYNQISFSYYFKYHLRNGYCFH